MSEAKRSRLLKSPLLPRRESKRVAGPNVSTRNESGRTPSLSAERFKHPGNRSAEARDSQDNQQWPRAQTPQLPTKMSPSDDKPILPVQDNPERKPPALHQARPEDPGDCTR